MGQLVLLLVAAAWLAVLIPPLLRARIENRPNNSVSDFRDQLSSLQQTMPGGGAVQMRSMGRSLVGSPLERPAAAGRPGAPAGGDGESALKSISINAPAKPAHDPFGEPERGDGPRGRRPRRSGARRGSAEPQGRRPHDAGRPGPHFGDPLLDGSASPRPSQHRSRPRSEQRPRDEADRPRPSTAHSDESGPRERRHRQARSHSELSTRQTQQRRRSNVLFVLALVAACSLFLALTTEVSAAIYVFVLSFLALAGYVYLLGQARQTAGGAPRSEQREPARQPAHREQRAPRGRASREHVTRQRAPGQRAGVSGERRLDIA